jgi:hypothetical protein
VAEKSVFHAWRIRLLVSVACADCDTPLNLLDCLVDYLDGVDPVTAFVVRGLHELIARPIQGIERPFHVTLVGMGVLDQRNSGDDENEDLAEKSGSHKKFQSLPRKNAMEICPRARKFVSARFTTRGALAAALLSRRGYFGDRHWIRSKTFRRSVVGSNAEQPSPIKTKTATNPQKSHASRIDELFAG